MHKTEIRVQSLSDADILMDIVLLINQRFSPSPNEWNFFFPIANNAQTLTTIVQIKTSIGGNQARRPPDSMNTHILFAIRQTRCAGVSNPKYAKKRRCVIIIIE